MIIGRRAAGVKGAAPLPLVDDGMKAGAAGSKPADAADSRGPESVAREPTTVPRSERGVLLGEALERVHEDERRSRLPE